tara:strand:+ start:3658 stop:4614 length:957 start_codon:yes stop_codon:yes gene_type:complete
MAKKPVKKKAKIPRKWEVTVIIAAWNEAHRITKSILSLLDQSLKVKEIIVVDDGSTDKTREVVKQIGKKHKQVKLLTQNRKGPGAAKNLAVKQAKGNLLVFSDADEFPKHDYIEKLTEHIRKGKAQSAAGAWVLAYPKNPWARSRFKDTYKLRPHGVHSKVFRAIPKSLFKELGGYDTSKGHSDDRLGSDLKRHQRDDAVFYHDVDSNVKELYRKRKWIGRSVIASPKSKKFYFKLIAALIYLLVVMDSLLFSWKLFIVLIAIIPALIFLEALEKVFFYRDIRLIIYYPAYVLLITGAMTLGFIKELFSRMGLVKSYG